jgi:hypothetical protein
MQIATYVSYHNMTASPEQKGIVRPNGLAFSCRERASDHVQKPNDLAREAVNCNAGLGGSLPQPC